MADRRRPAGRRAVSGPRGALPGSGAGGADPGSPAALAAGPGGGSILASS